MKIAVLLATFNRKEKTLSCLRSLFSQKNAEGIDFEVFITDDSSADGTVEAIKKEFPLIHIFNGNGSLFWAGGMRSSWTEARKTKHDHYLLLNDDTILDEYAIAKLLSYYNLPENALPAICIGSTKDNASGEISYGGQKLYNSNRVQCFNIFSETEYLECDMANSNIMLVADKVVEKIGILSDKYTHCIADFDYSLTAKKAGFKVVVVPGVLGYCTDDHDLNWKPASESLNTRLKYLKSPKGLAYNEYLQFVKSHFPLHLPAAFLKLWIKTLFPVMWGKLKS